MGSDEGNTSQSDQIQENTFQVFSHPITARELPAGSQWRWNQARRKHRVPIAQGDLYIAKLVPRRKTSVEGGEKAPSYKLWAFYLPETATGHKMTVLWCEKGPGGSFPEPPRNITPSSSPIELPLHPPPMPLVNRAPSHLVFPIIPQPKSVTVSSYVPRSHNPASLS